MKGKGTIEATFVIGQEKFKMKDENIYFDFVDVQKAYDGVPIKVIRWPMHKLGDMRN